jgi:hypothetical protein
VSAQPSNFPKGDQDGWIEGVLFTFEVNEGNQKLLPVKISLGARALARRGRQPAARFLYRRQISFPIPIELVGQQFARRMDSRTSSE